MKEAPGAKIPAKITWELEGEKRTKARKKKNADQAILSLKSRQNGKILKTQQKILTEVKAFYKVWIEINHSPQMTGPNDQN